MSRYLIGYLVFILFLFSGNIMAAKTGEVSEMGQMESALLQEQMQKIAAEGTAKTSPALPTTQKEQAAGEKKVNISYPLAIEAHGTDPIGQKLVFLLKKNFNKSESVASEQSTETKGHLNYEYYNYGSSSAKSESLEEASEQEAERHESARRARR